MDIFEFFTPSSEKLFFFFLVLVAANFPLLGTYHTERSETFCAGKLLADCRFVSNRQMLLNPIFWFPYIYSGGGDLLANTKGGDDDLRIPLLEFSKNPLYVSLALNAIFWYIAASLIVYPMSKSEGQEEGIGMKKR